MSFGGIGNILGNVAGMAVTPAMETYIQEMLRKNVLESDMMKEFIKDPEALDTFGNIAGGTLGTVLGTGLNAGLGYLTGGKEGAAAGAAQGLIMSGGAALQHDKFLESMGMGQPKGKPAMGTALASGYGTDQDISKITGPEAWKKQVDKTYSPLGVAAPEAPESETPKLEVESPTEAAESKTKKPGYFELTGEMAMPAWSIGMGLGSSMAYAKQQEGYMNRLRAEKAAEEERMQQFYNMLGRAYAPAYADGGEVTVSSNAGVPTTVTFPDWFVDEFAGTGGLGSYAAGGYINPQAFDPNNAYPQSMIHRAEPYPGAAPIRNEVVNMERGGLLEGEGDGMSDHIPANIDGKEEVRVADGEYVVPTDIAAKIGEDKLQQMLTKVRSAAHAKKGKQIVENAGKKAFIQTMSGVKA